MTITSPDSDRTVVFEIDGTCARQTRTDPDLDPDTGDVEDGESELCLDRPGEGAGPFEEGIPGIDRFWVVVVEEDGLFYVDPLASVGSYLSALDLDAIADSFDGLLEPTEPVDITIEPPEPADG